MRISLDDIQNLVVVESVDGSYLIGTFNVLHYEAALKLDKRSTDTKLYNGVKYQTKYGLNYLRKRAEDNITWQLTYPT